MNTLKQGSGLSIASLGVGIGALLALNAMPAHATLLALDDLNYSVGEVNGLTGGGSSGWASAWATSGTSAEPFTHIRSPGLSYLSLASVGLSLELDPFKETPLTSTSNVDNRANRAFSATINQSTVFVSFLLKQTGGTIGNFDQGYLWIGDGGSAANSFLQLGVFGQNTGNELGYRISNGTSYSAANANLTGGQMVLNTTYMFVAKMTKDGTGTGYDKAELWLQPTLTEAYFTSTTPLTVNLGLSGATGVNNLLKIGVGSSGLDGSGTPSAVDTLDFDRIRVGTTLYDVTDIPPPTAVPEPGTFAAAGVLAIGAGCWYRRRRQTAA